MRINVKILKGPDCSPIVTEDMSVHDLKVLVANELDIPVERQRLMFKGKPMHDNVSLEQYGVTNDSRVILSVKDADSNAASSASSVAATAACCSKQPELSSELMTVLLRHFTPADAERVAEEFKQDIKNVVSSLSLDDIEHIAKVNVEKNS